MKQKTNAGPTLSPEETHFIHQLRDQPLLAARFQRILDIARNAEGPLKTADQVEDLVVEELRRLGQETMGGWAVQAEERVADELKAQDPTVRSRKKKR